MKSFFASVFLLVISMHIYAQDVSVKVPNIIIKVALGETVTIDETQFYFKRIVEDSRCPKEARCIWAGRIKIEVEVLNKDNTKDLKTVLLGALHPNETSGKQIFENDLYSINAVEVSPYPEKSVLDNTTLYTLKLEKRKK